MALQIESNLNQWVIVRMSNKQLHDWLYNITHFVSKNENHRFSTKKIISCLIVTMAKGSKYMARVLRVVGFVLLVQIALSCASIPDEREGLLGRFLLASQEQIDEIGKASIETASSSSIFPVADQQVLIIIEYN